MEPPSPSYRDQNYVRTSLKAEDPIKREKIKTETMKPLSRGWNSVTCPVHACVSQLCARGGGGSPALLTLPVASGALPLPVRDVALSTFWRHYLEAAPWEGTGLVPPLTCMA